MGFDIAYILDWISCFLEHGDRLGIEGYFKVFCWGDTWGWSGIREEKAPEVTG